MNRLTRMLYLWTTLSSRIPGLFFSCNNFRSNGYIYFAVVIIFQLQKFTAIGNFEAETKKNVETFAYGVLDPWQVLQPYYI